jgi:hypothetical protein
MNSKDGWCDIPECYDEGGKCPYGEEEGNGSDRPDPGQNPDQCPDEHPNKAEKEILQTEGNSETQRQVIQDVHT